METKTKADTTDYPGIFRRLNCCVIIPVYNNESFVANVIEDVLSYTDNIILVNDGCTDASGAILESYHQLALISYSKNKGKGYALQKAFDYARMKGNNYAITMDADGQHKAEDLPLFLDELEKNGHSLILGSRNMQQHGVPAKSSFGNRFSNFWFWVETGLRQTDTQTGFRLYPLEEMERMKFFTTRFEFEVEVLVRIAWKNIPVRSVDIQTVYQPEDERVSHFRPFTDFFRISILNTILVLIAFLYIKPFRFIRSLTRKNIKAFFNKHLFKSQDSNLRIVLSVIWGVFMGIAPVWGYQLIIAISLAHLFKLNKVIVAVAANISVPPMIPFILYFSYMTGGLALNGYWHLPENVVVNFAFIRDNFFQYVIGSLIFGALLSLLIGMIVLISLLLFRKKPLKN